jgi:hypothetical protein
MHYSSSDFTSEAGHPPNLSMGSPAYLQLVEQYIRLVILAVNHGEDNYMYIENVEQEGKMHAFVKKENRSKKGLCASVSNFHCKVRDCTNSL